MYMFNTGNSTVIFKNHAIEHPGGMKPRQILPSVTCGDRVPITAISTMAV